MKKNRINPETKKQEITNKEVIMTDNHNLETTNNQENNMTGTNTTATAITNDELKEFYSAIKEDYAGLNENEKSSAVKSYNMGHNLNMLHKDEQYRNLTDNNGNQFKSWQSFCEEGCDFTRAYADKLMKSVVIQDELEQAGVTSIKQSVANLYAIHTAEKKDSALNIAELWKKATDNNPEAFPTRKDVRRAINPESHAPKKISQVKKGNNTPHDLTSLLTAIQAIKLSDEDKQQVRQVLDALLKAEQEDSPETTITAEPVKLSA